MYSEELATIVGAMLKVHPASRPDCESIISKIEKNGKIQKNFKLNDQVSLSEHNLLGTIAMPMDLKHLEEVLPLAKYDQPRLINRSGSSPKAISRSPQLERVTDIGSMIHL